MDLKAVADKFEEGQSLEDIKQQTLNEAADKFDTANLHQDQPYHEAGKRVIRALLDSKQTLDYLAYRKFFNNPEEANKVLEANVFAYHPEKRIVTFQSHIIECYILENANIFLK